MKKKLHGEKRQNFLRKALRIAQSHDVRATVVIEDVEYTTATGVSGDHEEDATFLFLERAHNSLGNGDSGVVIIAKPSGGRKDANRFLKSCLNLLENGTDYVEFENFPLKVLIAPSQQVRTLQLADLVTSCTTVRVSGETNYSPAIWEDVLPLLEKGPAGQRGGFGLKIHPDGRYRNLYHWLAKDEFWNYRDIATPMPLSESPYFDSDGESSY